MYFSHDTDARNEEKILGVRMELGAEGYGMYWMLLEKLAAEKTHVLTLDIAKLSWDLRCNKEKLKKLICDFGLFVTDEAQKLFWSEGLMSRMEKAEAVSFVRSEAGKASAEARKRKANMLNINNIKDDTSDDALTNAEQMPNKSLTNDEQNENLLKQNFNKIKEKAIEESEIKEDYLKEKNKKKENKIKSSSSKPSLAEAISEEDEEEDMDFEKDIFELWEKAYKAMKKVRMPAASCHEEWEKICRMLSTPDDEDREKLICMCNEMEHNGKNGQDIVNMLKLADRKRPINPIDMRTWKAINAINGLSKADATRIKAAVGRRKAAWRELVLAVEEWQRSKKIVQPGRFILSKLKTA